MNIMSTGPTGDTGPSGDSTHTGSTGCTGLMRPPYTYFNIGPTGTTDPSAITRVQLNEKNDLVAKYTQIKFQHLLTLIVNYHVEGVINGIIQILINNTGQTSHLHYLQVPPGKIMDQIVYNLSNVNYDTVKTQAIPIIIQLLQAKFIDSVISVNKQNTYIMVDWAIL